jgi:hypothetical protein
MLDGHARAADAERLEADLHLGGVRVIAAQVPQVPEPDRWLPERDHAPVVLEAGRRSLEDPATGARFEDHDRVRFARGRMVGWPPGVDVAGPDLEGTVARTRDVEGDSERFDHRFGRGWRIVAASPNWSAASPQTCSR